MSHDGLTPKQRYFKKKYEESREIDCSCGCGTKLREYDQYGRKHSYVSGHNGRKYKDPKQYKREWNHRNRGRRYQIKMELGRRRKAELVRSKGGRCTICKLKYDGKNASVFDLHHRNPEEKGFPLNIHTLINKRWELILVEVEKCDLICACCHRMIHWKEF